MAFFGQDTRSLHRVHTPTIPNSPTSSARPKAIHILAGPRYLIRDEATSSVDTRSEILIQQALSRLLRGRTSFVIARRLGSIRDADQVLVLQEGEVVERASGTSGRSAHDQILEQEGDWYRLYTGQFRGEAEGEIPFMPARGGDGRKVGTATAAAQRAERGLGEREALTLGTPRVPHLVA